MKHKKVFKSLEELSPELLGNTILKQTTPEEPHLVNQDTRQIFQPVNVLAGSDIRAYRGWGINE